MAVGVPSTGTRAEPRRPTWTGRRAVGVGAGLAALALVLRLPAYLSDRHLHFDDGVYGVSAMGMRIGQRPFDDLFSPQGPLHLVLVRLGDVVGLETASSPRLAPVLAGVACALAAWRAGDRLVGGWGALLAGLLVATSGTMLWTTGPITGDGIAMAFATAAVWAALRYRDSPSVVAAVLTGVAMGAALATKALVITAALPVGWWLWSHRRIRDLAAAVVAAGLVGAAVTLPFGFSVVWEQSVAYHRDSGYLYGPGEQAVKLVSTLAGRDLPIVVALGIGLAAWAWAAAPSGRVLRGDVGDVRDVRAVAVWAAAAALFLVFEPAMFRNHLASLVVPLALLVACHPPPARWFAVAAVVVAPWWAAHLADVLRPGDYEGAESELVAALRALPDGMLVIADEPGFVWRAGHATVPELNDTSIKRIDQGQITTASVAEAAAGDGVCAVVIWSNRFGTELPGLRAALAAAGYSEAERWPGERALWLRDLPRCQASRP